jgi:hypothetical protein
VTGDPAMQPPVPGPDPTDRRRCAEPGVPEIVTRGDPFARSVFHERHPRLVGQLRQAHPYGPAQHRALQELLVETTTGTVHPLPRQAHDHEAWDLWGRRYVGQRWEDVPCLWAESYFYRRLLDAVGFFTPGPWFWVDPFAHLKIAELADPALEARLATLDEVWRLPVRERGQALLLSSLWGNRADLGFRIGLTAADGRLGDEAGLVADDSDVVWSVLHPGAGRDICLVADNAGRVLLSDLILIDHLIDHLITTGAASEVVLHVKPSPYYVSDAVTADVASCLRRLGETRGAAAEVANRLRQVIAEGRVTIGTHWFYCAPWSFHHLPSDLAEQFTSTSLTLMKGDLNYRRLVGDCRWPPSTPFAAAAAYFPGPVVALRVLKFNVVVGLDPGVVSKLDESQAAWRTSGTHGLIQARM